TVWHKGKPATIKWKILEKADVTSTTIELLRGDPENLDHIMVISNKVNPNSLAHTWTVKNDLPAGKDYVIQIGEENHKIRYSHKFEIAN
ncbi:8431_t:CDS:2, partial [Ambispora gerdemannii]